MSPRLRDPEEDRLNVSPRAHDSLQQAAGKHCASHPPRSGAGLSPGLRRRDSAASSLEGLREFNLGWERGPIPEKAAVALGGKVGDGILGDPLNLAVLRGHEPQAPFRVPPDRKSVV